MSSSQSFNVELVRANRVKRDTVTPDVNFGNAGKVSGRDLMNAILEVFEESNPALDFQPKSDEDLGWELVAENQAGDKTTVPDNTVINLSDYTSFRAVPRTVAGAWYLWGMVAP